MIATWGEGAEMGTRPQFGPDERSARLARLRAERARRGMTVVRARRNLGQESPACASPGDGPCGSA